MPCNLATAFIILEVVDIVTPALHLPSWTVNLVLVQDVPYDYTSWAFTNSAKAYRNYLQGLDFYFNGDYT